VALRPSDDISGVESRGVTVKFRLLAVVLIATLFALGQMFGSAAYRGGDAQAHAASVGQQTGSTVQQDNADEDDDNDEDDASDNADGIDNDDDSASDNDDGAGNDNDVADDEDADETGASTPSINDDSLKQPLISVSGTSTGSDVMIATPGDRVTIQMFPWMPAGVQVTIRPVDPNTVSNYPGQRAGDLVFAVDARDANGAALSALPAEVNLAIRYADDTVANLNEGNLTISRLDPTTNQWSGAPKLVRETDSNYIAASITQLGTYVVSAQ
jgi:hypothetical protein